MLLPRGQEDSLFVVNPKKACSLCQNDKLARGKCEVCRGTGFRPVDLNGLWYPSSGFLVCGGPSVNKIDKEKLRERGVVSLAVNNVAGHVPVTAWCFGDPQIKFHHGVHLDPKCLTFAPLGKLRKRIYVKLPDGTFRATKVHVMDCPGVYGFARTSKFIPSEFFSSWYGQWGRGGDQPASDMPFKCLCTMLLGFRLMHYLGCPRIYLLGVDLWMDEASPYAFNQQRSPHNRRYWKENAYLKELKPVFKEHGFEVFNCNPDSKCDVFDYVPFEKAYEDCRGAVPIEPFDLSKWYDKSTSAEHIARNPQNISLREVQEIQNLKRT